MIASDKRLFPYSLKYRAKSWLNSLEPNSVTTWQHMVEKLLVKYFPSLLNSMKRDDITSFIQTEDETLRLGKCLRILLESVLIMGY